MSWVWLRYQSGCSILATSQDGSCSQAAFQGGSRIPVSISGSVVLPRTQSYTVCTVWKLRLCCVVYFSRVCYFRRAISFAYSLSVFSGFLKSYLMFVAQRTVVLILNLHNTILKSKCYYKQLSFLIIISLLPIFLTVTRTVITATSATYGFCFIRPQSWDSEIWSRSRNLWSSFLDLGLWSYSWFSLLAW